MKEHVLRMPVCCEIHACDIVTCQQSPKAFHPLSFGQQGPCFAVIKHNRMTKDLHSLNFILKFILLLSQTLFSLATAAVILWFMSTTQLPS